MAESFNEFRDCLSLSPFLSLLPLSFLPLDTENTTGNDMRLLVVKGRLEISSVRGMELAGCRVTRLDPRKERQLSCRVLHRMVRLNSDNGLGQL